jgi:membrane protein implicated in regulation of membrane protease activity
MSEFLVGLSGLDKVFLICACVGGLLFVIRTVMQFLGADSDTDGAMGVDLDLDGDADSDASFRVLSIQMITVFFMMFGLVGLCLHVAMATGAGTAIIGGFAAGTAACWIVDKIMRSVSNLQSSGTIDLRNAIGQAGTVYLRVPADGTGKVQVTIQGRLKVMDAVSQDKTELKTNERILVVDVLNNTLLVKAEKEEKEEAS